MEWLLSASLLIASTRAFGLDDTDKRGIHWACCMVSMHCVIVLSHVVLIICWVGIHRFTLNVTLNGVHALLLLEHFGVECSPKHRRPCLGDWLRMYPEHSSQEEGGEGTWVLAENVPRAQPIEGPDLGIRRR